MTRTCSPCAALSHPRPCHCPQITAALDATEAAFGTPNTAVNCAGIAWAIKVLGRGGEAHDLDKFATTLMVNTVGSFNVIRLSAERMAKADADERGERGVIVNTARSDAACVCVPPAPSCHGTSRARYRHC